MTSPFEALNVLHNNRDKNFVQRALHPEQFPVLDNPDGSESTHSMAWGTGEGKQAFVYPTVIQMQPGNWLQRLDDMKAWEYAKRSGEFIEFDDAVKAADFSKNYKKIWQGKAARHNIRLD